MKLAAPYPLRESRRERIDEYNIDFNLNGNYLEILFEGKSFYRYMVRNMVGLLIEIGEEKRKPSDVLTILEKEDRKASGKTAPACGLYLKEVNY